MIKLPIYTLKLLFVSLLAIGSQTVMAQEIEPLKVKNESSINTAFQEYSPAFYQNGLVFIASNPAVATDKKEDSNTGKATTSIFFTMPNEEGVLQRPIPFAEELTTKYYDGPLSFNKDGSMVYFTRSNLKKGKPVKAKDGTVKLKIYSAEKKDNKWGNIEELPFNNSEFDCAHPSVSQDGRRLYFSSNRPGGFGGMDLYVSTLLNGKWSEPVNLGPKINTSKNEIFPFSNSDGKVVFASNGHEGVGNLDIFFTMKTDTGWLKPRLLPEPINSRSDDFGFIFNSDIKIGFFSSNRASGNGDDDIFKFALYDLPIEVLFPKIDPIITPQDEPQTDIASEIKKEIASTPVIEQPKQETTANEKANSLADKTEVKKEDIPTATIEQPKQEAAVNEKANSLADKTEVKKEDIPTATIEQPKQEAAVNEKTNSLADKTEVKKEDIPTVTIEQPKQEAAANEKTNSLADKTEVKTENIPTVTIEQPKQETAANEKTNSLTDKTEVKKEDIPTATIEQPKQETALNEKTNSLTDKTEVKKEDIPTATIEQPKQEAFANENVKPHKNKIEPSKKDNITATTETAEANRKPVKENLEKNKKGKTQAPTTEGGIDTVKNSIVEVKPTAKDSKKNKNTNRSKTKVDNNKTLADASSNKESLIEDPLKEAEKTPIVKVNKTSEYDFDEAPANKNLVQKLEGADFEEHTIVISDDAVRIIPDSALAQYMAHDSIRRTSVASSSVEKDTTMSLANIPAAKNELIATTTAKATTSTTANTKKVKKEEMPINIVSQDKVQKKYLVVVGTYSSIENANLQKKKAVEKGYGETEIIQYNGTKLYGVCVQQFSDEKEAQTLARTIKGKSGLEVFVKVLR